MEEHKDSQELGERKNQTSTQEPKKKNSSSSKQAFLLGIAVFVLLCLVGLVVYGAKGVKTMSDAPVVLTVAKVFNLPAATVNGAKVSYADFIRDKGFIKTFYDQQALPGGSYSEEELAQQAMARLIANEVIVQQAEELGVTLSKEELDTEVEARLSTLPDREQALKELEDMFGWGLDEYVDNVIYYQILEERLAEAVRLQGQQGDPNVLEERQARHILFPVESEENAAEVLAQAQEVLARIQNGEDFAVLAQEFGTDGTAAIGGDLGFFPRGVMTPAFEEAVFSAEVGTLLAEPVQTDFGYHIVEVTGQRFARNYQAYMDNVISEAEIVMKINLENPFTPAQLPTADPQPAVQQDAAAVEDTSMEL